MTNNEITTDFLHGFGFACFEGLSRISSDEKGEMDTNSESHREGLELIRTIRDITSVKIP